MESKQTSRSLWDMMIKKWNGPDDVRNGLEFKYKSPGITTHIGVSSTQGALYCICTRTESTDYTGRPLLSHD